MPGSAPRKTVGPGIITPCNITGGAERHTDGLSASFITKMDAALFVPLAASVRDIEAPL
jgi:hypothetical protein